jgi:hypothetical protein
VPGDGGFDYRVDGSMNRLYVSHGTEVMFSMPIQAVPQEDTPRARIAIVPIAPGLHHHGGNLR